MPQRSVAGATYSNCMLRSDIGAIIDYFSMVDDMLGGYIISFEAADHFRGLFDLGAAVFDGAAAIFDGAFFARGSGGAAFAAGGAAL